MNQRKFFFSSRGMGAQLGDKNSHSHHATVSNEWHSTKKWLLKSLYWPHCNIYRNICSKGLYCLSGTIVKIMLLWRLLESLYNTEHPALQFQILCSSLKANRILLSPCFLTCRYLLKTFRMLLWRCFTFLHEKKRESQGRTGLEHAHTLEIDFLLGAFHVYSFFLLHYNASFHSSEVHCCQEGKRGILKLM